MIPKHNHKRLLILHALEDGPVSFSGLNDFVRVHGWKPSQPGLSRMLRFMEEEKLIKSMWKGSKVRYRRLARGTKALVDTCTHYAAVARALR